MTELFESIALRILGLVISRDALRARPRRARGGGLPLLKEASEMVAAYLVAEQDLGRVPADADVGVLAPMLLGAAHLLFAGSEGATPAVEDVRRVVVVVVVVAERPGA